MGTRAYIFTTCSTETVRLYRGSDGYPRSVLAVIHEGIIAQEKILKEKKERDDKRADILAGTIIGASVNEYGMGTFHQEYFEGTFNPEKHVKNEAWDVEYTYVVDVENRTVHVYGGDFKRGPRAGIADGPIDPLSYAERLYAEFQENERKRIQTEMDKLEALGYKINPVTEKAKTKKPAAKKTATKKAPAKKAKAKKKKVA